jgi:hypothetical protein
MIVKRAIGDCGERFAASGAAITLNALNTKETRLLASTGATVTLHACLSKWGKPNNIIAVPKKALGGPIAN